MPFEYPCPDCGQTNNIHKRNCEHEYRDIREIRKTYIDIISVLLDQNSARKAMDVPPGIPFDHLREQVDEMLQGDNIPPEKRGAWTDLHTACLHALKDYRRVDEKQEMGGIYLKSPEERQQEIIPTFDPIKTIYEHGPVDGAKDYAVYTMVSWCELVGLNWEQTVEFLTEWLEETKSWEELSWGERSIGALLRTKKHVHDRELGWGDYGGIAADHIRQSDRPKQIDAQEKAGSVDAEDYG